MQETLVGQGVDTQHVAPTQMVPGLNRKFRRFHSVGARSKAAASEHCLWSHRPVPGRNRFRFRFTTADTPTSVAGDFKGRRSHQNAA